MQYIYEDSMDLIAKLPTVAATIYRNLYRDGSSIGAIDTKKDWSANFASMLGYTDPQFTELLRLYLTIHRYIILAFNLRKVVCMLLLCYKFYLVTMKEETFRHIQFI